MARRNEDILKKLSGLKPSVPTSTRAKAKRPGRAKAAPSPGRAKTAGPPSPRKAAVAPAPQKVAVTPARPEPPPPATEEARPSTTLMWTGMGMQPALADPFALLDCWLRSYRLFCDHWEKSCRRLLNPFSFWQHPDR